MKQKKIKILFFTPYGGYTGSEMMLLYLLSNLNSEKFEVKLFSLNNGALLKQFPKHIEVFYSKKNNSILNKILSRVYKKTNSLGVEERQILKIHRQFNPDFWYLNTMILDSISELAIQNNIKFVVHFHELLSQYASISSASLDRMVSKASFNVGCSEVVCDSIKVLGARKVLKQYECVDFSRINVNQNKISDLKSKYGIPNNTFVIVMSGQRIERKGFDIFIETALRLKAEEIHFVWLGASKNTGYELFLENKLKEHKSSNITIIETSQEEYYDCLNLGDAFFLTSREDPFPLVMLEAAYLGKPILAFNSGGSNEFVKKDVGYLLPDFLVSTIDKYILLIIESVNKNNWNRELITENAKEYDVSNQSILFEKLILEQVN